MLSSELRKGGEAFMRNLNTVRDRDWVGCVDFGTAFSKIALVKRKGRSRLRSVDIMPLALGSTPPFMLPSLVFVTPEVLLFGAEAQVAAVRAERAGRQAFSSPKQYLSTYDIEDIDEKVESSVDPTNQYTPRQLLVFYLAFLFARAEQVAVAAGAPWPVPLRIARPAWKHNGVAIREKILESLVIRALAVSGQLGRDLLATGGVPHSRVRPLLSSIMDDEKFDDNQRWRHVFELSDGRAHASVLEATAAANATIRNTGRRVVVVADIGAGTSDFGAFMTGLPDHEVIGEIPGSSRIVRQAGDHVDMLLTKFVLDQAGIDPDDPAGRGAATRLRARQRNYKQVLFAEGEVTIEMNDDHWTVTRDDFLENRRVKAFSELLRAEFSQTLEIAVRCARQYSFRTSQVPIEIVLTGGGHNLPMVKDLADNPGIDWKYAPASREIAGFPDDPGAAAVGRQLAVAIGGAIRDLPVETAPVHL